MFLNVIATGISIGQGLAPAVLAPLSGVTSALTALAAASGALAIVAAVCRAALFSSDESHTATAKRVVRVLLVCSALAAAGSLAAGVWSSTGAEGDLAQAIQAVS